MTINRTTLLDLPLPVTGTEAGTWGDVTNNGLTEYLDIAIAGMVSLTSSDFTAGALTIATTEGGSASTGITNASAQYATLKVSSLAANSTITAPASARAYRVINADATYTLTVKASGQTGVTFQPGTTGMVAFNGTDYEIVGLVGPASATDNAVARFDGTTGQIVQNSVVTIADSTGDISGVGTLNATTVDTTNLEVTNLKAKDGTAAGSIADSTGVVTLASSVLTTTDINGGTIDGTTIGGSTAAAGTFTTLASTGNTTLGDASTDTVTVNGYMGVGGAGNTGIGLYLKNTALIGANQRGILSEPVFSSAATGASYAVKITPVTAAASFTAASVYGIGVDNAVLGAGSAITDQYGIVVADQTRGTNNYGITSAVSSGTNKWNIYASGTAANYFAGNVGIGTTNVERPLDLVGSSTPLLLRLSGSVTDAANKLAKVGARHYTNAEEDVLAVFAQNTASENAVFFGGGSSSQNSATQLKFFTGATNTTVSGVERFAILSTEAVFNDPGNDYDFRVESDTNTHALFVDAGNSRVGVNNSSPAVALDVTGQIRASTGILFGSDTAAANALDDYETGTFTPVVEGVTTAGTGTYTAQSGFYVKIGQIVHYTMKVAWSAHTGTGTIKIVGLPYTSANDSAMEWFVSFVEHQTLTIPASSIITGLVPANNSGVFLYSQTVGSSGLVGLAMDSAATLWTSGTYKSAS